MAVKQIIKRKVAMASLRADDDRGRPSVHSILYRRKDGTLGYKPRVTKSFQSLPGEGRYRGNVKLNHEFLFRDLDKPDAPPFRLLIDLLVEMDGHIIDHTNGEYRKAW